MKSSCKITFEGLNIARLLATLTKTGTTLYSVERQGKRCTICVPARRSKQTIALLKERCYNIIGIEYFGTSSIIKFAKKRFLLPLFCLLAVVVIAISSQYCLKIVVSGDFDSEIVCQALSDAGVKVGANLSKLNMGAVQNSVANSVGAMYAVVTRSGSVLYVNVVEKKQIDPPIDMTKRRDIVATRAGVVTNLLCEQGNALVKVGDTVKVGDVLIEGKRIFNDGMTEDVYALGRVTLQITATGFAEYNGYKVETVETGEVFSCTGVVLFGNVYQRKCPFEQYTESATVTRLAPLNLEIRKTVYRELHTVSVPATIEECLAQLQAKAYDNAYSNCDFVVLDTQYTTKSNGVVATLYGEMQIE